MAHSLDSLKICDPPFGVDFSFDDLRRFSADAGALVFRIKGMDRSRTRVAVTLLHGNEPSGARAVMRLIREGIEPACDSLLVLGSLEAAFDVPTFSHRFLPGRRDRNRVFGADRHGFSSTQDNDPDFAFACSLLDLIASVRAEALIDIHNNTGHNPPYGIVLSDDPSRLGLVSMFAEKAIVTDLRLGTLMEATDVSIPSVSIEAGRAGDPQADQVAYQGLVQFLTSPILEPVAKPLTLYADPVRVELAKNLDIAFAAQRMNDVDIVFSDKLDHHNFALVESGTPLGWVNNSDWPLVAVDGNGRDISRELFEIADGILKVKSSFIPIMMTLNATVAVQDCLFYVVHQNG